MRYKVSYKENLNVYIIEDVLTCDERLLDGQNERYGTRAYEEYDGKRLFKRFRQAIWSRRKIMRLDYANGKFNVDWVEYRNGEAILHNDTLEFESETACPGFVSLMSKLIAVYSQVERETKFKIAKVLMRKANDGDMVKRCSDLLVNGKSKNEGADVKATTEMYDYIKNRENLFSYGPQKLPFYIRFQLDIAYFLTYVLLAMAVSILGACFASGLFLDGVWLFLLGVYMFNLENGLCTRLKDMYYSQAFQKRMKEIECDIDMDYLKELRKAKTDGEGEYSLADFLEKDIEYIHNHPGCQYDEGVFRALGKEYASAKFEELIAPETKVEKADYLERMCDLEVEMYATNRRYGLMNGQPAVLYQRLFDVLVYLGWSMDEIKKDRFVLEVIGAMKPIIENAYEGCEVELSSLIKVAVQYARCFDVHDEHPDMESDERVRGLMEIVDDIFYAAQHKLREAEQLDAKVEAALQEEKTNNEGIEKQAAVLSSSSHEKTLHFEKKSGNS